MKTATTHRACLALTALLLLLASRTLPAAELRVPTDYPGIQAAIDAANPAGGDRILVSAGTYGGPTLVINKPVELIGAQAGVNPVVGGRAGGESIIRIGYTPSIVITASNVGISGFEISDFNQAIYIPGSLSRLRIAQNWIHSASAAYTGGATGTAIATESSSGGSVNGLMIETNIIHVSAPPPSYAFAAINLSTNSYGVIYDDVYIGANDIRNDSITGRSYGLYAGDYAGNFLGRYVIRGMVIKGNYFHSVSASGSTNFNVGNIIPGPTGYPSEFRNNVVENCGGIIGMDTGTISGNTFRAGARLSLWGTVFGYIRPSNALTIENNDFTDELTGLGLEVDAYAYNSYGLGGAGGASIQAASLTVRQNAFRNSGLYGNRLRNLGLGVLPATNNWWGTATGPYVADPSDPANPLKYWLLVPGSITASPWLNSDYEDPAKLVPPNWWPLSTLGMTRNPGFWPMATPPAQATSMAYLGPILDEDGDGLTTLKARLSSGSSSCYAAQTIHFYVDNIDVGSAVTDADGLTNVTVRIETGTHEVKVAFLGTGTCLPSSATATLNVVKPTPIVTILDYTGPTLDADGDGMTTLSARLSSVSASCYVGQTIHFYVDGTDVGSGVTDGDGRVALTVPIAIGGHAIRVNFSGAGACQPSSASVTLSVTIPPQPTTVAYTGPTLDADGDGFTTLTATLAGALPACQEGQQLYFILDRTAAGSGVTDATGNATLTVAIAPGVHNIEVVFRGTGSCLGSSTTATLNVTIPPKPTTLAYTGPTSDADGNGLTTLSATLSSAASPCYQNQVIHFLIDGTEVGSDLTDANGNADVTVHVAVGTHAVGVAFSGTATCLPSSGTGSLTVTNPPQTTALTYTGPVLDADGNGLTTLAATLSSADSSCYRNQVVHFYIDGTEVGSDLTDLDGQATATVSVPTGVHEITVAFPGTGGCLPSEGSAILTVAIPGDSAFGGGWYKPTVGGQGQRTEKASFGFVVQRGPKSPSSSPNLKGQLIWTYHKLSQLKSTSITQLGSTTVSDFAASALISGTGEFRLWEEATETWSDPVAVTFLATVCDGGSITVKKKPQDKPDGFGLNVIGIYVDQKIPLVLSGGSIKVN